MVRAHVKQTPEDKKETHKKKPPAKKKSPEAGSWPCKINGCNKVFAREADLKRHQRTTKSHSVPGFACPQCEATFTRTDALRRHQKSRHNGIVIDPGDKSKDKDKEDVDDAGSSVSKSSSRSGSPAKDAIEVKAKHSASPPHGEAPPSGPSSYYRQHTMHPGYGGPPHLPPLMIDPHYHPPPVSLPTSAARLHHPGWPAPPPWPLPVEGGPPMPPPGPMYHLPPYYASPYYRHHGPPMVPHVGPYPPPPHMHPPPEYMAHYPGMMHPGMPPPPPHGMYMPPPHPQPAGSTSPASATASSLYSEAEESNLSETQEKDGAHEAELSPVDPAIDPTLANQSGEREQQSSTTVKPVDTPTDDNAESGDSHGMSMDVAQAAVAALLQYESDSRKQESSPVDPPGTQGDAPVSASATDNPDGGGEGHAPSADADADIDADGEADLDGSADHFTEGGMDKRVAESLPTPSPPEEEEPMLKPSDLLTQESLASPPPS